jgi:hypothetical protein
MTQNYTLSETDGITHTTGLVRIGLDSVSNGNYALWARFLDHYTLSWEEDKPIHRSESTMYLEIDLQHLLKIQAIAEYGYDGWSRREEQSRQKPIYRGGMPDRRTGGMPAVETIVYFAEGCDCCFRIVSVLYGGKHSKQIVINEKQFLELMENANLCCASA